MPHAYENVMVPKYFSSELMEADFDTDTYAACRVSQQFAKYPLK